MKLLHAIVGHAHLFAYDPGPGLTKPITAQAEKKGVQTMTTMSDVDKRLALQEALRRTFKQLDPHGQVINESELPQLVKVYPEHITYRREGRIWRDGYVLNSSDGTATLGGVPVLVVETEVERDAAISAAVRDFFKPLKAAGDLDPVVKEVRARDSETGSVVALFAGAYYEMPFLFEGQKCWVSSPRPMEPDGGTFTAPKNMVGAEIVAMTDKIMGAMKDLGRDVPFADAQVIASKVCAAPPKADLGRFLTELFNASKKRDGR